MNNYKSQKTAMLRVARLDDIAEDWAKALQDYQALAQLFPEDPFILEPLSRAQLELGMEDAARLTLAKAAQCYKAKGYFLKAAKIGERAARLMSAVPA